MAAPGPFLDLRRPLAVDVLERVFRLLRLLLLFMVLSPAAHGAQRAALTVVGPPGPGLQPVRLSFSAVPQDRVCIEVGGINVTRSIRNVAGPSLAEILIHRSSPRTSRRSTPA
jgi:hypothetical protein